MSDRNIISWKNIKIQFENILIIFIFTLYNQLNYVNWKICRHNINCSYQISIITFKPTSVVKSNHTTASTTTTMFISNHTTASTTTTVITSNHITASTTTTVFISNHTTASTTTNAVI